MSEFETEAALDIVVEQQSVRSARKQVEQEFSATPISVDVETDADRSAQARQTGSGGAGETRKMAARDRARTRQILTDQTGTLDEIATHLETLAAAFEESGQPAIGGTGPAASSVAPGPSPQRTDGSGDRGGRSGRRRRRERREYRWARQRTEHLDEIVTLLHDLEGGGGGGGILGELLGGVGGGAAGLLGGAIGPAIGSAVGSSVGSAVGDAIGDEALQVDAEEFEIGIEAEEFGPLEVAVDADEVGNIGVGVDTEELEEIAIDVRTEELEEFAVGVDAENVEDLVLDVEEVPPLEVEDVPEIPISVDLAQSAGEPAGDSGPLEDASWTERINQRVDPFGFYDDEMGRDLDGMSWPERINQRVDPFGFHDEAGMFGGSSQSDTAQTAVNVDVPPPELSVTTGDIIAQVDGVDRLLDAVDDIRNDFEDLRSDVERRMDRIERDIGGR